MKARRPIERGWATNTDNLIVTRTSVDNVITDWQSIITGEELADSDDAVLNTDQYRDYYLERIILTALIHMTPGTGNDTNILPGWVGLAIVSNSLADKEDVPAQSTGNSFVRDLWRALPQVRRVLRAELVVAPLLAVVSTGFPGVNPRGMFTYEWSVQGPVHLRKDEELVVVASQTGESDAMRPWVEGDDLFVDWFSSVLVRKKRGA